MLENIILGFIQGVAEWLPISSEGLVALVNVGFFERGLEQTIEIAIFLHLGTFFAALFYFREDIYGLTQSVLRTNAVRNSEEYKRILIFLIISTLVTGLVGFPLLKLFLGFSSANFGIKTILGLIGTFLILTGIIQFKKPEEGFKGADKLSIFDGILLGIIQGFSALPGLSRSGLTIAGFLFRGYKDTEALRLSFLMSLPAVLGANIIFNFSKINFDINMLIGLVISFVVGLATIHAFITLSHKINFGWFAILFGALTLLGIGLL